MGDAINVIKINLFIWMAYSNRGTVFTTAASHKYMTKWDETFRKSNQEERIQYHIQSSQDWYLSKN